MSSDNKKSVSVPGGGFTSLLTVLFIGLKLTGYINWSWWWVLSPIWIMLGIVLLVLAFVLVIKIITD